MFHDNQTWHYTTICNKLGYQFKSKRLLQQALTRRTAIMEGKQQRDIGDYQRLEFLGDKVINLAISDILYEHHPDWAEGQLTRRTEKFVNNKGPLATVANNLDLSTYLIIGADEERRKVYENIKVLSDAVEALFGAVFLDSGRDYALIRLLVIKHWSPLGLVPDKPQANELIKLELKRINVKPEDKIDKKLIEAVKDNNYKQVVKVLESGANPNLLYIAHHIHEPFSLPYGISLLMLAMENESTKIVKKLLDYGANPNWQGTYEIVELNPLRSGDSTGWEIATHQYKTRCLNTKYTAMHWLILIKDELSTMYIEFARLLLNCDADLTLTDYKGRTPVMLLNSTTEKLTENDKELKALFKSQFKKELILPIDYKTRKPTIYIKDSLMERLKDPTSIVPLSELLEVSQDANIDTLESSSSDSMEDTLKSYLQY